VRTVDVDTPHGPGRVHLHEAGAQPVAALVLGHGAGGGVAALDLLRATEVANEQGVSVALVEQPYRVAGRRSPAPPAQLDAAWLAVIGHLAEGELAGLPLIAGGRSLGARVACRTAAETGAIAVLCLAFPVHPPGRPEKSRLEELDAVEVPTLVVQGKSDPFGMPPPAQDREVVEVEGDHGLKKDLDALGAAVGDWLRRVTRLPGAPAGT
jgi:predicted alpha/beta-hydrolase family hydrolase